MSQPVEQILVPYRKPELLHGFPVVRPLVGRSGDLAELVRWLDDEAELLTLLGPPGIGKTSLATWAAMRWSRPAWFCDLSNCHDGDGLRQALLASLGEPAGDGRRVEAALAEHAPSLVVLDNFEQLVGEAEQLASWRRAAPTTRWLVTSRERLAVDGERVLELGPLSLPEGEAVESATSVQLFLARARDAGGRGLDQLEAIATIVSALDGVPLAIELAAARTRLLAPEVLAKRLEAGLLSMAKRGPSRHRTLADAIAWSWALLSPSEQQVLMGCAVFAGSFTAEGVERVLDDDIIEPLASLRDKSLVHTVGAHRLGLYASVRAYARTQWAAQPRAWVAALEERHARLFVTQAASFNRHRLLLSRAEPAAFPVDFQRDLGNLQAALAHTEGAARIELASALVVLGGRETEPPEPSPTAPPSTRAVAAFARHRLWVARGDFEGGHALLEGLMADETMPLEARAMAAVVAGVRRRIEGDARRAEVVHAWAAERLDPGAHPVVYGINVACMGRLGCDLDDAEAAERCNAEAVRHQERVGEWSLAGLALANLAQRAQEKGDYAKAEALLERAIQRFRDEGETTYESVYAAICGGLYLEQGRYELARRWFASAPVPDDLVSLGVPRLLHHGGYAVLEALEGCEAEAEGQLERARRVTAHADCALVRGLTELYVGAVDLALGRGSVDAWRARLDAEDGELARLRRTNIDVRFAARLVVLAMRRGGRPVLKVHPEARWFELGGERVDLGRRGAPRLILRALVRAHVDGEGALGGEELVAEGWPGERILVEAAATRVRVAIATLRKLGLREVIVTRDDGYLIDPGLAVELIS